MSGEFSGRQVPPSMSLELRTDAVAKRGLSVAEVLDLWLFDGPLAPMMQGHKLAVKVFGGGREVSAISVRRGRVPDRLERAFAAGVESRYGSMVSLAFWSGLNPWYDETATDAASSIDARVGVEYLVTAGHASSDRVSVLDEVLARVVSRFGARAGGVWWSKWGGLHPLWREDQFLPWDQMNWPESPGLVVMPPSWWVVMSPAVLAHRKLLGDLRAVEVRVVESPFGPRELWRLEAEPGSMTVDDQQRWLHGFAPITTAINPS